MRIFLGLVLCLLVKVSWGQPKTQYYWLKKLGNFKIEVQDPGAEFKPCNSNADGGSQFTVLKYGFKIKNEWTSNQEREFYGDYPTVRPCPEAHYKCDAIPGEKLTSPLVTDAFIGHNEENREIEYGYKWVRFRGGCWGNNWFGGCSNDRGACSFEGDKWVPLFKVKVTTTGQSMSWKDNLPTTFCLSDQRNYNIKNEWANGTQRYEDKLTTKVFFDNDEIPNAQFNPSTYKDKIGAHRIRVVKSYDNGDEVIERNIIICDRPAFTTANLSEFQYACPKQILTINCPPLYGGGAPTYQWKSDSDNYQAVVGSNQNLVFNNGVESLDKRSYKVFVRNQCGATSSNETTIAVYGNPVIKSESDNQVSLCPDTAVPTVFSVEASADYGNDYHSKSNFTNLTYQWLLSTNNGADWSTLFVSDNTGSYSYQPPTTAPYGNGYQIKCIVSDGCLENNNPNQKTNIAVSQVKTIRTFNAIPIRTQPLNQNVCGNGDNATFAVDARANSGSLTYQWQKRGKGLSNDSDFQDITLENNSSYTVASRQSDNGNQYRCVLMDACGERTKTISGIGVLNIISNSIEIRTQPLNQNVCGNGDNATFAVDARANSGSLTYQWQKRIRGSNNEADFHNITLENNSSYTIASRQSDNGNQYRCVLMSACGERTKTSGIGVLNIISDSIKIRTQPLNQNVCGNGDNATFAVEARANRGSLTYQWQKRESGLTRDADFHDITLENNSSYTVASRQSDNGNQYRCVLMSTCGESTKTSKFGVLNIISDSIKIRTQPINQSGCGNNDDVTFSIEAQANQGALTYQWQKRESGLTRDADFHDIPLENNSSYTLKYTRTSDHGTQYRCVLTDNCGRSTQTKSRFAALNILRPIRCIEDPKDAAFCENTQATIMGANFSGDTVDYKWYYSPQPSANLNQFTLVENATLKNLTIDRVLPSHEGHYYCVASNKCYQARSVPALLTVNTQVRILTPPADYWGCVGDNVTFRVAVSGAGPYSYTWHKVRTTIPAIVGGNENSFSIASLRPVDNSTSYKVTISGACGQDVVSTAAVLRVHPKPSAPVAPDVAICDAGNISSSVVNPAVNENYRWYSANDLTTPVYEGKSPYTLTLAKGESRDFKVFKVVNACASDGFASTTVRSVASRSVNLGEDLSLCYEAAPYNLAADIADDDAKGGIFEWRYNNAAKSGNLFSPKEYSKEALIGRSKFTFVVIYTPPASGLSAPHCFQKTEKNIFLVKVVPVGSVKFKPPVDTIDKTITLCINTGKNDLSTWVEENPNGGRWGYGKSGKRGGLTGGGKKWYYEPNSINYDNTNYNELVYTGSLWGCSIVDTVKVYVKNNLFVPVISSNVERVCQDEKFTLTASVANNSGLSYVFSKVNDDLTETELSRQNPDLFQTTTDARFSAYTIDEFKCNSAKGYITILTPFGKGQIQSNRSKIDIGETIQFSFDGLPSASYVWDFGDRGILGYVKNPIKQYFSPGTFNTTLTVIGTNSSFRNCPPKQFDFPPIVVSGKFPDIITALGQDSGNFLFPNPVSSKLVCRGPWVKDAASVVIISVDGKVGEMPLVDGCVDVSHLSVGLYTILSNNVNFKFIKK